MSTHEFTRFLLEYQADTSAEPIEEAAIKDVTQLVSGSLIYRLYEALIVNDYDTDEVTEHLEMLYDTENHFALLYFIFMLCDAADVALPERFVEMTASLSIIPHLSAAIIKDWLDFHGDYEN